MVFWVTPTLSDSRKPQEGHIQVMRRCAEAKTIHGRETRAIRTVRAEKLAELKFYFKMLSD